MNKTNGFVVAFICSLWGALSFAQGDNLRATGDLGVIVARATGELHLVNHSSHTSDSVVSGLGDLSHASVVFSRDQRFAYVFGRDGGLTKVDLLTQSIAKRIVQAGNSIGGAISQDGRYVAVSNYEPGGVRIFDSRSLALVADIPATPFSDPRTGTEKNSKVVGLVDAPGNRFVFSLFDTGEIWIADMSAGTPVITRFSGVGKQPYDALISGDGRYYVAGLFGERGMAMLDLWQPDAGVKKVLHHYGTDDAALPVYKMPHLEGWAIAGGKAFVPAVGQHKVLVFNLDNWQQEASIDVKGQPVFVMARPDGRHVWVNFAHPDNQWLQVIDTLTLAPVKTLEPGPAVLHMEFTPRGEQVWVSVRDNNQVLVYDTADFSQIASVPVKSPSGIFFTSRAHRMGL